MDLKLIRAILNKVESDAIQIRLCLAFPFDDGIEEAIETYTNTLEKAKNLLKKQVNPAVDNANSED